MEKLELTIEMLSEINKIAVVTGCSANLGYSQLQLVLSVKAIEKFLHTYGIELPVSVDKLGGFRKPEQEEK